MINLYHSRRGRFRLCKYFIRNENDSVGDLSVYIHNTRPSGIFYAKEDNAKAKNKDQVANVFMYDKSNITISTMDSVEDLTAGCIVAYRGEAWIVDSVQERIHTKETEYGREKEAYTTFISLRR